jgi:hypothetical protein
VRGTNRVSLRKDGRIAVQTFLPYPCFAASARVLDFQRLGKQRVEARQIFDALTRGTGWSNHAASRMWRGYETALLLYSDVIIREWVGRGYKNNMPFLAPCDITTIKLPPWLGRRDFHASHRSNLLRKKPDFYEQYGWSEPQTLPYVWPA